MKTFLHRMWALGIVSLIAFSLLNAPAAQARPGDRVSFQTFYDELDRYGRWINDAEYGYVWSPNVEREFQPYATRGHWVMTEYGNTWVSDYEWGWAPFHYGRWIYDDYDGWLWIPGSEWGPAWVNWRNGGGYYGWAPMGPRVTYLVPAVRWVFVPVMYITSPRIYSYCVPRHRVVNIYHNTTIINNYYERDNRRYVYGPRNQDIERATNRSVNVYRLDNDNRPGRTAIANNSVRIYRPEVNSRREEAPTRVATRNAAMNRSNLSDANAGTVDRSDRSSNSSRSGVEGTRSRSASEESTSRPLREVTSEQRSTDREAVEREGVRTRGGMRGTTSTSEENSAQRRSERPDHRERTDEVTSTGTRSRSPREAYGQRSEEPASPRRMEPTSSQDAYQTRTRPEPSFRQEPSMRREPSVRQESSGQGQYQQRSRQESAPAQAAPAQRQDVPRQEPASGRQSSRSGRN